MSSGSFKRGASLSSRATATHMGAYCTTLDKDESDPIGQSTENIPSTIPLPHSRTHNLMEGAQSKLVKRSSPRHYPRQPAPSTSDPKSDRSLKKRKYGEVITQEDKMVVRYLENWSTLKSLDSAIDGRLVGDVKPAPDTSLSPPDTPEEREYNDYLRKREETKQREHALAFDFACFKNSTKQERKVDKLIQKIRERDEKTVYAAENKKAGHGGQEHERHAGDHFLSNYDLIERTDLFRVAKRMPKGAHLHIHFNSCLKPRFLLGLAGNQERMFIKSTKPLVKPEAFDLCEIQFSILSKKKEMENLLGDIFDENYNPDSWMKYSDFRKAFSQHFSEQNVDAWLEDKLVFHAEEAHGMLQTVDGAWVKFNGRTRMMKGLFNYETAYREYTRACLQDFVDDNIQYAEIRPNFMHTNQVWTDDGERQHGNAAIMAIIEEECKRFQEARAALKRSSSYFQGIKVIYCTPRSFSNELVKRGLDECIEFKKRWPTLIAGFDLVGEESKGKPLKDFVPEFLAFKNQCKEEQVDIPFLFHCGETLEMGNDTDENLMDALLLGSKRIGHGFALARHPYVMEKMKENNVCLEVCPISNEILGLTPRVNGHAMYNLLANNVHCTINSDNGTLFRSSLSHDFYQVMIGKQDMSLHGWRQLIEWSLKHACLDTHESKKIDGEWLRMWREFLNWVEEEFGKDFPEVE